SLKSKFSEICERCRLTQANPRLTRISHDTWHADAGGDARATMWDGRPRPSDCRKRLGNLPDSRRHAIRRVWNLGGPGSIPFLFLQFFHEFNKHVSSEAIFVVAVALRGLLTPIV